MVALSAFDRHALLRLERVYSAAGACNAGVTAIH